MWLAGHRLASASATSAGLEQGLVEKSYDLVDLYRRLANEGLMPRGISGMWCGACFVWRMRRVNVL